MNGGRVGQLKLTFTNEIAISGFAGQKKTQVFREGHAEIAQMLLDAGADAEWNGY
jgi:hypothetical protein